AIDDPTTAAAVRAERAFLAAAGTGCQTPAGCWARVEGEQLALTAFIVSPDGAVVRGERRGAVDEAEALGAGLAREVVERAGRRSP
ncbi:MAG: hydroxymethylbilane synthase, partial [Clostridia bacterium]|nr:hydroxymethylbilane synthase [Clostridia bacterium]